MIFTFLYVSYFFDHFKKVLSMTEKTPDPLQLTAFTVFGCLIQLLTYLE